MEMLSQMVVTVSGLESASEMLDHSCHQDMTSLSLMHWLRLCVTLCIASAVANALSLTTGLGATLSWSSIVFCELTGTIEGSNVDWAYKGDDISGVTLTLSGSGTSIPEIQEGQHWKADAGCYQAITDIKLGSVTSIGARAFNNIRKLMTIDLKTVTTIGDYAFENSGVPNTPEPNVVTSIGIGAFKNAKGLNSIIFKKGQTVEIKDFAFEGSDISTLDASDATVTFGTGVMKDCKSFRTFLAQQLDPIPESMFEGCSRLNSMTLGEGALMNNIGKRAFYGCSSIRNTFESVAGATMTIGESAFEGTGITRFDFSKATSVSYGRAAFKDCSMLTVFEAVDMPSVPESCFEGCSHLMTFTLKSAMTSIGNRAFFGCSAMVTTFGTESGTTLSIGESAFEGSGVSLLSFAGEVSFGRAAFKDCIALQGFQAQELPSIPESLFEGCVMLGDFRITGVMVEVHNRAFCGCSAMMFEFQTAKETTLLGESAFEGSGVTKLILTQHADTFMIGASAFKDCKGLTSMQWSPTYDTMPDSIFEGSSLEFVEIPATVTKFGEGCFRNCKVLVRVKYDGLAQAPSSVFAGCDALISVEVPKDYQHDEFGGYKLNSGLSLAAKIGIGVGVALVVIIVIIVVVVVLVVTGTIGGGKRDAQPVEA